MIIMLSTEICRLILRKQPPALLEQLQEHSANGVEVVISAITYAELVAGVLLTQNQEEHMALVAQFCERLEDIAPWNREAVDCYTRIQQQAMARGFSLNLNDAMIAAHAVCREARLLVLNARVLAKVPGLDVSTWEE